MCYIIHYVFLLFWDILSARDWMRIIMSQKPRLKANSLSRLAVSQENLLDRGNYVWAVPSRWRDRKQKILFRLAKRRRPKYPSTRAWKILENFVWECSQATSQVHGSPTPTIFSFCWQRAPSYCSRLIFFIISFRERSPGLWMNFPFSQSCVDLFPSFSFHYSSYAALHPILLRRNE